MHPDNCTKMCISQTAVPFKRGCCIFVRHLFCGCVVEAFAAESALQQSRGAVPLIRVFLDDLKCSFKLCQKVIMNLDAPSCSVIAECFFFLLSTNSGKNTNSSYDLSRLRLMGFEGGVC